MPLYIGWERERAERGRYESRDKGRDSWVTDLGLGRAVMRKADLYVLERAD